MPAFLLLCLVAALAEDVGESFRNSVGLLMLRIEPGTFTMGTWGQRSIFTTSDREKAGSTTVVPSVVPLLHLSVHGS